MGIKQPLTITSANDKGNVIGVIEINIISATPGISTQEQILQLIQARRTGITIKEINKILNRPISMIQVYLKDLIATKAVISRENKAGVGLIYYPSKRVSRRV